VRSARFRTNGPIIYCPVYCTALAVAVLYLFQARMWWGSRSQRMISLNCYSVWLWHIYTSRRNEQVKTVETTLPATKVVRRASNNSVLRYGQLAPEPTWKRISAAAASGVGRGRRAADESTKTSAVVQTRARPGITRRRILIFRRRPLTPARRPGDQQRVPLLRRARDRCRRWKNARSSFSPLASFRRAASNSGPLRSRLTTSSSGGGAPRLLIWSVSGGRASSLQKSWFWSPFVAGQVDYHTSPHL